jgi:lipoprotein signal peptidase
MAERSYRGLFWGLAFCGVVLDQASKYGMFRWLYQGEPEGKWDILPGVFQFLVRFTDHGDPGGQMLSPLRMWNGEKLPLVNQGALFSLGVNYGHVANVILAVASLVVALAILYWSTRSTTRRDPFLNAALGLILAGALGNFYDRVVFHGVRDFLYFYWIEWPVFNIADCCLVCGALLLPLSQALTKRSDQAAEKAAPAA